jgi:hypothetical protein
VQDPGAHNELVANIHEHDNGGGEVGLEEVDNARRDAHVLPADRAEAGPELGNQNKDVEDQADPAADDTNGTAEGELVERVALEGPRTAEADVGKADAAPLCDGIGKSTGSREVNTEDHDLQ